MAGLYSPYRYPSRVYYRQANPNPWIGAIERVRSRRPRVWIARGIGLRTISRRWRHIANCPRFPRSTLVQGQLALRNEETKGFLPLIPPEFAPHLLLVSHLGWWVPAREKRMPSCVENHLYGRVPEQSRSQKKGCLGPLVISTL
jgi:hypothetical protein